MKMGRVIAVSISKNKGTKKKNVPYLELKEDFGIVGDAHSGSERQVSILSIASIEKMKAKGLEVAPGDFAENITAEGLSILRLNVNDKIRIGEDVFLQVTQIGKVCHKRCAIYYQAGDCVMPKEGVFAKVLKSGIVKPGDKVEVDYAK